MKLILTGTAPFKPAGFGTVLWFRYKNMPKGLTACTLKCAADVLLLHKKSGRTT